MIEHAITCLAVVAILCSWHYWCAQEKIAQEEARKHKNECIKELSLAALEKGFGDFTIPLE